MVRRALVVRAEPTFVFITMSESSGGTGTARADAMLNDPRVKEFLACAAVWLVVKTALGPEAVAPWVGSGLVFGWVAVLVQSVGFQWQPFFYGLVALPTLLRLGELLLGSAVYDLVVIVLLAMYFTKPAKDSFDGRPVREMRELEKELKAQQAGGPLPPPPRAAPTTMLERLYQQGKELVIGKLADVLDAQVPIEYTDLYLFWLVTAKFSERLEDQVFYVGTFGRWFNLHRSISRALITAERFQAPPPPPPPNARPPPPRPAPAGRY